MYTVHVSLLTSNIEALQKIFPGLKIKTDTIPLQERWKTMTEDERLAYVLELQVSV